MMNIDYIEECERVIMKWFAENYPRVGSIITLQQLIHLKHAIYIPQVRDQMKNAIDILIGKGYLIHCENGYITLTQAGYDALPEYL